jgi:hypothetical protein
MKEVVTIAPLGDEPGLIAYECSKCAHLMSVRIPTMPISRSSGSRSVIPIDPDQCGVA